MRYGLLLKCLFSIFPCQFFVREPLPNNLPNGEVEPVRIVQWVVFRCAIVVAEHVFVKVAMQMERLNRYVGAAHCTLEKTPEIFQPVCMYTTVYVFLRVVYKFVRVF